jgi:hypothetical protein
VRPQSRKQVQLLTGSYESVELRIAPDNVPSAQERSQYSANYPTQPGFLHVYLDGQHASKHVPSGYMLWILAHLLGDFNKIVEGGEVTALWYSDPWQLDVRSIPVQNRAYLTLHIPECSVVMRGVSVPLRQFADQVIRISQPWLQFLRSHYPQEVEDPRLGIDFRRVQSYLTDAHSLLRR